MFANSNSPMTANTNTYYYCIIIIIYAIRELLLDEQKHFLLS
jgi:hypothetical protein